MVSKVRGLVWCVRLWSLLLFVLAVVAERCQKVGVSTKDVVCRLQLVELPRLGSKEAPTESSPRAA